MLLMGGGRLHHMCRGALFPALTTEVCREAHQLSEHLRNDPCQVGVRVLRGCATTCRSTLLSMPVLSPRRAPCRIAPWNSRSSSLRPDQPLYDDVSAKRFSESS
eukprot:458221-Amphidinium_carterae.1